MSKAITSETLLGVRSQLPDVMEDLGQIAGLLREAINDTDAGNVRGARMVADDALEAFATLEAKLSEMSATVAKWSYVEEGGSEP